MPNERNLKRLSPSEARKNGQKGGQASGKARRERKALKDELLALLADGDTQEKICIALLRRAQRGDIRAFEVMRDTVGEKPGEITEVDQNNYYYGLPSRLMGSDFVNIHRDIQNRKYRFFDFEGGRGSLKSSFCALELVDLIMQNPKMCGIAMREVADTLRESVYAQTVWAISELGLEAQFTCTVTPMKITKNDTGQVIYFRGGNDPMKIKSIKPPNGMYIGVAWFEEKDQFRGTEAIRNIIQSIMRGGDDMVVLSSYNTPRSQRHFINVAKREAEPTRIIHKSCYLNAPIEWLGEPFFEFAEQLRLVNEKAYRHEYLGEAVGTGLNVFDNIVEREIPDDEIKTFDRLYYGLDWGWFPHPNAFTECYFNRDERKLYIYGEICRNKTKNEDMAVLLDAYRTVRITADPGAGGEKSISDFQAWGFNMQAAIKGPGSIEVGIKWMQSLTEIVIDPVRCPKAAEQFAVYEYLKDKDGNPITGYPDEGDDFIDSTRYALEEVWRRRGE